MSTVPITPSDSGNVLVQKRNVIEVPTDEAVIAPGAIEQLIVKPSMSGTLLAVAVGPKARIHKLFVGKQALDAPEDLSAWRPNAMVKAGGFVILTVENLGDEPAVFRALLFIDAPNHKIVVGPPQAPPPVVPPPPVVAPVVNVPLTQALPPAPATTPADHGVKPGLNEVAVTFMRNDAQGILSHLRSGSPLDANIKHAVIRRLDDVLKPKR
jgi:hypothetical protein